MPFAPIPDAIEDFRAGRMLVIVDDEDRENEGDLTIAAEKVTSEAINFLAKYARGLICLALSSEICDALELRPMTHRNTSRFGTAFCESIEAAEGVTTGISAADRARTIRTAIAPGARPQDLAKPGHIFPLRAREGGVLVRAGQTEAAVDLARLAGLRPGGVICEIMNEDGTMARVPQLETFCAQHGVKMISVASLIRYRLQHERFLVRQAEGCLRTRFGSFKTIAYSSSFLPEQHMVLVHGDIEAAVAANRPVLVRMHARCLLGDVFGSTECECHGVLERSLERIAEEGAGVLVYLHQTGPAIRDHRAGPNERRALHEAGIGAQILSDLGLRQIRLLTNHPRKVIGLDAYGIEIIEQLPV